MIDLAFEPFEKGYKRCGCYVKSEEFVNLYPNQHILVPLKSSEYNLEIVNAITSVTLIQTYQNPTDKFLELQYSFPINPNACVYRFVAEFGKIRVEGIVKEKEEARKEYQEAISQGKRAAIGEINSDSKDILTLKVGNVGPGETARIEIAYLQELSLSNNTFYQLHLPGTISPRYMNFVPKEEVVKGCRNQGLKTQGKFYWNFKISLRTTRKVVFFDSSSHDITLLSQNDSQTLSEFVMTEASVPNKDFVFTYTTQEFHLPSYVYGSTDVSSSAMVSFIPKFCSLSLDDAYKASVHGTTFETDIENAKGEYVFLLDRSGSMGGKRIQKAKEALILFIKSLPQDTYFNVVSFGSGSKKLFPNSVKYGDKEVQSAVQQVKRMSADMGGTEVYNPLKSLLEGKPTEGYPKQVFLLTDGGVSNTEGVIKMVGLNNKYARVHTIAVGNGASEALILGCAKSGKGHHVFITDEENPSQKIIQLLTDSLSPVISNIRLKYDKEVIQSIIPNPESLPYVLKGELVNFYINFKGQLSKPTLLSFSYEDSANKLPFAAEITVEPEPKSLPFVDKMGQFKKIRLLEESFANGSNIEESMYYVKIVDKKALIVRESLRHQILSEFTAFICVEQQLIDGKYSQIKNTGQIKVIVDNPSYSDQDQQEQQKNSIMSYKRASSPLMMKCAMPRQRMECAMPPQRSAPIRQRQQKMDYCARPVAINCFLPAKQQKKSSVLSSFSTFFGKIGNTISNAFSSSQSQQTQMALGKASFQAPQMQKQVKQIDLEKQSKIQQKLKDMCIMDEKKSMKMQEPKLEFFSKNISNRRQVKQDLFQCNIQEEMKIEAPPQQKKAITIESLIGWQTTDGSWRDVSLLTQLYSKEVEEMVSNGEHLIAVLTYLIAKWIEKNHPQKQYSLVIKKGLNFVKKEIPNHEQLLKTYEKFIK